MSGRQKHAIIADLLDAGWREVPRDVHDVLCPVRVATRQGPGPLDGLMHCAFCSLAYAAPEPAAEAPYVADGCGQMVCSQTCADPIGADQGTGGVG